MVERSECSRWLNVKYIVSFDHKEQFARIDNFLVIQKIHKCLCFYRSEWYTRLMLSRLLNKNFEQCLFDSAIQGDIKWERIFLFTCVDWNPWNQSNLEAKLIIKLS